MQRSVISLIAGIVLAVIAVGLLSLYIGSLRAPASSDDPQGMIVIATTDLPFGEKVKGEYLKVVHWPAESIPQNAFRSKNAIFEGSQGADRIVLRPISKGEPILKSAISGFGARATMSREVAPGMRAISIRINDVSGVAGFILPGDHVDVMLTRSLKGRPANDNLVTDVILQDVMVLGIDQLSNQQHDKPLLARTVTVQVTQKQAQMLALAEKAGTLSLALRNVNTTGVEQSERVNSDDLAENTKPRAHHATAPGVSVVYGMGH